MAINITTWSPDTCGCVIHYAWDDSLPSEKRIHTPVDGVTSYDGTFIPTKRCDSHTVHTDIVDHHGIVVEENQRKNKIQDDIVKNLPILTKLDANGNTLLKDNVLGWSFDANRNLNITLVGITAIQKNNLQIIADGKYGNGKVIIN